MANISIETIKEFQKHTFRMADPLHTPEQAVDFVNERGFIFFWPVQGTQYPNLWHAVAGERSVADAHDDPGHISWNWKDSLLDKRVWYYGRILKKK